MNKKIMISKHGMGIVAAILWAGTQSGCTQSLARNLEAYRAAKRSGDYATAGQYLADDARIWFGRKEGPGNPLTVRGGPYRHWDKEFNSRSIKKKMKVRGRTLSYVAYENNDYFRLIERQPTPARVTYYFDEQGRITGMLYKGLSSKEDRPPDRRAEFDRWAAERYPGLLDSPEMEIPNNPGRWRELLTEWRADVGLPAIE